MFRLVFLVFLCQSVAGRRNVLFLVADDMRPDIEAFGQADGIVRPKMHTPNLDRLAGRSLLLKQAHVQQALCGPSRTSLLTSRRPDTTRVYDCKTYWRSSGGNFTTLPQYFKENGYRTIGVGKIYHGGKASNNNDPMSWTDPYLDSPDKYKKDKLLMNAVSQKRLDKQPLQDTLIADQAIEVLRDAAPKAKAGKQPFFLAVGFRKPHIPWTFPDRFLKHYPLEDIPIPDNYYASPDMSKIAWHTYRNMGNFKDVKAYKLTGVGSFNFTFPPMLTRRLRQAYYSAVTATDFELGRVISELDRLGLSKDTVISFWGDHGWQLGEHAEWQKQTNFDLSTHAPMMLSIPGKTDRGIVSEELVEFVDLFPTLVDAVGIPKLKTCPQSSKKVRLCTEGTSFLSLVDNPKQWLKNAVFSQYPSQVKGLMGYTLRTKRHRYTEWVPFVGKSRNSRRPMFGKVKTAELYDHQVDPAENVNLAYKQSMKNLRQRLKMKLRKGWRAATRQ
ncbi:iduronate 2-sulfatase-like [Haliotis asinina]|uniref:iduronate 2-sulfatase-like n=1 Tax=Haliotis asinina TaxID=109174 RepID=UPI003531C661